MAQRLGREALLIEFGSGSSLKIRSLLQALQPSVYMPVDISGEHLMQSAQDLADAFPGLIIHAVCADYSGAFGLSVDHHEHPRAAFFPGSSVGNFEPMDATRLLTRIGQLLGPGGRLLIGADFDLDAFRHRPLFNAELSRIEMHLLSTRTQQVAVAGQLFDFAEGESIHTECSYKYRTDGFHALAAEAGFSAEEVWTDPDGLFSVHCLIVAG